MTNSSSGTVTVVGGEVSSLGNEIMTGQAGIYYGQATTESTYFFPSATVEAWDNYMASTTAATSRASSLLSMGFVMSQRVYLWGALAIGVELLL